MRTIAELAAAGLRGKALTDAMYEDRFGHPPPATEPTPEERQQSLEKFFALMATFTDEELAEDIFAGRPTNTSILEDYSAPDAYLA